MKKTKIAAVLMASLMSLSAMAGCNKTPAQTSGDATTQPGETQAADSGKVKEFSAFFAVPAPTEINKDNEIQKIIAEKIGAKCNETWLTGQKEAEAVGVFIASGEYPDFINGGDATINPHFDICSKEITIVGSWVYTLRDYATTFDFLKRAQAIGLPIKELITHKFPLDQINEAMGVNVRQEGLKIAIVNK